MSAPSKLYEESGKIKLIAKAGKKPSGIKIETDPEKLWAEQAHNLVWSKEWDRVLDWQPPFAKWFVGGRLNASVNCLDLHMKTDVKNKVAIIWEGEDGQTRTFSYFQLYRQVNKFANVLQGLGVAKGD
ncbi:MAG TPA: acetyl-coenzyme A synthetase N-terminal domain-containing protein, partial [Nitrososphaera sp.]